MNKRRTDGTYQPNEEELCLALAAVIAEQSSCPAGARHGAILVLDGFIITSGYGTPPLPCEECWLRKKFAETGIKDFSVCPSRHAEIAAIESAIEDYDSLLGGTIYVTREPCEECKRRILEAGIVAVWPKE